MRWLFIIFSILFTLPASSQERQLIVAQDGTGDFRTIREALDAVPDLRRNVTVIRIRKGVYKEKLVVAPSKRSVKFLGDDPLNTIITYDDFASKKNRFGEDIGTSGSASAFIYGEGFTAENITFQNTSGPVGQAVAILVAADKAVFRNCRFLGFQDTLYTFGNGSRQYYNACYIEGTTDFIFGSSTAVFEACEIFCKAGGHYITAASTPDTTRFGYVFMNCRITGDAPESSFFLGRPWRPYAKAVFLNCNLGPMIRPEGWHNWGKVSNEETSFYAEFNSSGKGAAAGKRVAWSRQLSRSEAEAYTLAQIFRGWLP